jgi:molecular chaperone GrpE
MARKKKEEKPSKDNNVQADFDAILTDLQRTRADFENYRKRVDIDKQQAREAGKAQMIIKLLPVIDNIERAITHVPEGLQDNQWVKGIIGLQKNLEKALIDLDISRIVASPDTTFDPHLHEAIMMEDGDGDKEVIAEELQAGYKLGDTVIRHSLVKVKKV